MRALALAGLLCTLGCATTVHRLPGDPAVPGGPARTPCESRDLLVVAETRAEVVPEGEKQSRPELGLGLYRVGESKPESIPDLELLPPSDVVSQKREALAPHGRDQVIAGVLGAAGVIAIGIGTGLFVSAFESSRVARPEGGFREESSVNGSRAGLGAGLVGGGFALGITGLALSPSHAERTRANATRYVFLPGELPRDGVLGLAGGYNDRVRQSCAGR